MLVVAAACHSPGSINGQYQGKTITPKSAAFFGTTVPVVNIGFDIFALSDSDDVCKEAGAMDPNNPKGTANKAYLLMAVADRGSVGTKTYTVQADFTSDVTTAMQARMGLADADGKLSADDATAGSLKLSAVGSSVGSNGKGDFDLTFKSGAQLKGSIDADWCPALQSYVTQLVSAAAGKAQPD